MLNSNLENSRCIAFIRVKLKAYLCSFRSTSMPNVDNPFNRRHAFDIEAKSLEIFEIYIGAVDGNCEATCEFMHVISAPPQASGTNAQGYFISSSSRAFPVSESSLL